MAINIPTYDNVIDPENPLTNVYAYMSGIALDVSQGVGQLVINLHPREEAWQGRPLDQIAIRLGETLIPGDAEAEPPVEEVKFYTLEELMAIPEFLAAYQTIGAILYQRSLSHPKLVGAQLV